MTAEMKAKMMTLIHASAWGVLGLFLGLSIGASWSGCILVAEITVASFLMGAIYSRYLNL